MLYFVCSVCRELLGIFFLVPLFWNGVVFSMIELLFISLRKLDFMFYFGSFKIIKKDFKHSFSVLKYSTD